MFDYWLHCRESLNGPGCDAIHITEIETDIDCDTFIPPVDASQFQPWYSSFPLVENGIRHCFTTYVRVKSSVVEESVGTNGFLSDSKMYSFLPKKIFENHQEYLYLKLVEDIISNGALKGDRTGTGTLSKFGCQVLSVLICLMVFCFFLMGNVNSIWFNMGHLNFQNSQLL